jgi:hypothetical protein
VAFFPPVKTTLPRSSRSCTGAFSQDFTSLNTFPSLMRRAIHFIRGAWGMVSKYLDRSASTTCVHPVNLLHCLQSAALGPVAIGRLIKVGLEDRLEDQLDGRLHHPISDRGYPKGSLPRPSRLGYPYPPDGLGLVGARSYLLSQVPKPLLNPFALDLLEALPIHPGRTTTHPTEPIGMREDVFSAHLVEETVEAVARLPLGLDIKRHLELPKLLGSC